MKILIISHFQGEGLPTAIFVFDQARAYREQGAEVCLLIPVPWGKRDFFGRRLNHRYTETELDGVRCCFVRYLSLSNPGERGFNAASAIRAVDFVYERIFSGFSPDLIQAHTLGLDSTLGKRLKKRRGCPLVLTTHGSDTSIPFEKGEKDKLRAFCAGSDAVVCVSGKLKRQLASSGVGEPLQVIPNGFDLKDRPGAIPSGFDWIEVCNLLPHKHVDTTLRAFRLFRETYPQALCRIVGQGPERGRLEALCRELGVEDSVLFLGQLDNSRVREEMARSRFFVMISHPEGFGVVYLEAMSSGCVTIGTQGEGIEDVIENGVNGFLVPPDDADAVAGIALRCAADPDGADEISRRAVTTALGLTWHENAEKNLKLFKDLID